MGSKLYCTKKSLPPLLLISSHEKEGLVAPLPCRSGPRASACLKHSKAVLGVARQTKEGNSNRFKTRLPQRHTSSATLGSHAAPPASKFD